MEFSSPLFLFLFLPLFLAVYLLLMVPAMRFATGTSDTTWIGSNRTWSSNCGWKN